MDIHLSIMAMTTTPFPIKNKLNFLLIIQQKLIFKSYQLSITIIN